jgi:hypothetical protein
MFFIHMGIGSTQVSPSVARVNDDGLKCQSRTRSTEGEKSEECEREKCALRLHPEKILRSKKYNSNKF